MVMPYILDTLCSRKSVSSTFEQQDATVGGEDGIIFGDTSIMSYPPPAETRRTDGATSHKAFPAKSSWK
jgi:hypothetical protein